MCELSLVSSLFWFLLRIVFTILFAFREAPSYMHGVVPLFLLETLGKSRGRLVFYLFLSLLLNMAACPWMA